MHCFPNLMSLPVTVRGAASENLPGLKIAVARAAGEKCLRCWKQAKTVGF